MKSRWIIVADRTQAHIFSESKGELTEHGGLLHTAARLHDNELQSDKQGRASFAGESLTAHGYASHTDPHEHEAKLFAEEIVAYLDKLENHNQLASLVLVAEPKMLGLIEAALPSQLEELVETTVRKDLCHLPRPDLLKKLKDIL